MQLSKHLLFLLLATPGLAFAIDCSDPTAQVEINLCANRQLETETAAINSVYNRYRANLGILEKQRIKEVQLAWIKYRDLACKFEAWPVEGGSMHPYVLSQCLIKQSKIRRRQLEELLRCDTGVSPGANCNS